MNRTVLIQPVLKKSHLHRIHSLLSRKTSGSFFREVAEINPTKEYVANKQNLGGYGPKKKR